MAVALTATCTTASAASPPPGPCRAVSLPTRIDQAPVTVRGTLCTPPGPVPSRVELLVPGVTYDSTYWTLPAVPQVQSYVSAALVAGNATLAVDPPGTGTSDRADADSVNLAGNVAVVHQFAAALRGGQFGTRFGKVVAVGHSFGSSIVLDEAAQYDDLDAVIASGFAHGVNSAGIDAFFTSLIPTSEDALLHTKSYPAGYFTTKAGTRAANFYQSGDATRITELLDEASKSVITTGEENDIAAVASDPEITSRVRVPVLVVDGQQDNLFCGTMVNCSTAATLRAYEAPFFSGSSRFDTFVLPGAGHSINLHQNAPLWFTAANAWVSRLP